MILMTSRRIKIKTTENQSLEINKLCISLKEKCLFLSMYKKVLT